MKTFDEVMAVTNPISGNAAFEDMECRAMYDTLLLVPPMGLVVEIGCQLGRSSSIITQLAPGRYHSIHIDPYTSQPEYLKGWHEMMWRVGGDFTHAYTHLCMRTEQAAWHLERFGPIDLAFIDGDHEYPGVMTDLRIVAKRVIVGGFLCCHDYGRDSLPGVFKAVTEYMRSGKWEVVSVVGTMGAWRRVG